MDTAELKNRIKENKLSGVYLFAGEEEYLSRYYSRELISAVGDDSPFAVFNNLSYDGEDLDFAAIKEAEHTQALKVAAKLKKPLIIQQMKFCDKDVDEIITKIKEC